MSTTITNDLSVGAGPPFDAEIRYCRIDAHTLPIMLLPDQVDALRKALYPFSTAGIVAKRERAAKKAGAR